MTNGNCNYTSTILSSHRTSYEVVKRRLTRSTLDSSSAHLPSSKVAKAVIVGDDGEFVMSVVASNYQLSLLKINQLLGKVFHIATEKMCLLFNDCEVGAIPALGSLRYAHVA